MGTEMEYARNTCSTGTFEYSAPSSSVTISKDAHAARAIGALCNVGKVLSQPVDPSLVPSL